MLCVVSYIVCCFIFESVHKATKCSGYVYYKICYKKFENKQEFPKFLFWLCVPTALPSAQGQVNPKPYDEADVSAGKISAMVRPAVCRRRHADVRIAAMISPTTWPSA